MDALLVAAAILSLSASAQSVSRGVFFTATAEENTPCTVHFLNADYKRGEARYACGEWFVPEPGDHVVWLEGENRISPMWTVIMVPQPPAKNEMRSSMPLVDAGVVTVDRRHFPPGGTVRMVSLSHDDVAFERRVLSIREAEAGVLMPVGLQIVAAFGPDGNATAIAPPLSVTKGEHSGFTPVPLGDHGAVFAILDQPHRNRLRAAQVSLRRGDLSLPPDVLKVAQRRVYAVWYSVAPGDYEMHLSGAEVPSHRALVQRGTITTLRSPIKPYGTQ